MKNCSQTVKMQFKDVEYFALAYYIEFIQRLLLVQPIPINEQ